MICSIVRTVKPGTICSYAPGRSEVYFLAAYRPCLHCEPTSHDMRLSMRGRTWEETQRQARELAETFQKCCFVDGITYSVEEIDDESTNRAPSA